MTTLNPLINEDGEVREITMEDLPRFKRGRPPFPTGACKKSVHIMLDPDLLVRLRTGGKGWQTRINAILRQALKM